MIERKHKPIIYKIYNEMKCHTGKKFAISGGELSAMFFISQRQLREYIHEICESTELSKIILTCNKGYYIPLEEEGITDISRIYNQAFSLLRRARALEKKAGLEGQYKLKLGKFYKDYITAFGDKQ